MTKMEDCFMCQDVMFQGPMFQGPMSNEKGSRQPQKIADLDVSTAILNRDWQFFRGTTILVFQDHLTELHHLTSELPHRFMDDAARMAAALEKTFPYAKLNHGLFGNTMPHLHWHIIVRRSTDPDPKSTIWESEFPKVIPSDEDFLNTAAEIRRNL